MDSFWVPCTILKYKDDIIRELVTGNVFSLHRNELISWIINCQQEQSSVFEVSGILQHLQQLLHGCVFFEFFYELVCLFLIICTEVFLCCFQYMGSLYKQSIRLLGYYPSRII